MGGCRDGFKESCPIPTDKEHVLDGADRTDPALEQVTNLLPRAARQPIVVVAINEDGILGAIGAANTLGRQTDLYYGGQGTDPSIWKDVACNPNYIAIGRLLPRALRHAAHPEHDQRRSRARTIPKEIFTEHEVVNKDNIRDIYPETPAC